MATSAEISISHKRFGMFACYDALRALERARVIPAGGMRCSETFSSSAQRIERGCALRFTLKDGAFPSGDVQATWRALQQAFPFLQCAHVHVSGAYQGCILDYLKPTQCQGNCRLSERGAND